MRKLVLIALSLFVLLAGLAVLWAAQPEETGRPQFTTIPIHNRMLPLELKNGHVVYIPPRAGEMVEAGGRKPGGGKPGGGGGHGGGGSVPPDFGSLGAVEITGAAAACFANSANNFDATCAKDSYQGETMVIADAVGNQLLGSENDIYPGNCSAGAANGGFGDCGLSATVSTNGQTWSRFKLSRNWGGHDFLIGFDPSAAVDSQGNYFVVFGVSDSSGPNGIVAVSFANGGATWTKTNPVVLNLSGGVFEDKYWVAADHYTGSQFTDRLYVAWDRNQGNNQILEVATSADQGKTWSGPTKINDGRSRFERVIYAFPAVAPDHTVYVLWHDYAADKIFIDKSTNGGATWGNDVAVASGNIGFGTDIGCNGGRSMGPAPQMAIDASGAIYVVFAKNVSGTGGGLKVFITKSTNGGQSWSAPAPVSPGSAGHEYNPSVAIDSLGFVNVTYLDRRHDPGNCRTNTYLSRSIAAGGLSFTDTKISDFDSSFDGNPNGPGDYASVACLGSSCFPYFPDHRNANAAVDGNSSTIDGGFEVYSAVQ